MVLGSRVRVVYRLNRDAKDDSAEIAPLPHSSSTEDRNDEVANLVEAPKFTAASGVKDVVERDEGVKKYVGE